MSEVGLADWELSPGKITISGHRLDRQSVAPQQKRQLGGLQSYGYQVVVLSGEGAR